MARAYSTLGDVIEQLRQNNQTNVDINQGIAGLENMFGKFFADLKRSSLEENRESGKGKAAEQTGRASGSPKAQKSGGGLLSGLGSLRNLGFLGSLGAVAGGITLGAIGILKALGPAGVGLGAFFIGLAGAEAIIQKFAKGDAGAGIKNLLINLSEGLSSFSSKAFIALGTVLAAGVLFPGKTMKGLAAVGIGLAGFFTALAGSDKLIQMMDGDGGANLKVLLTNIAGGLDAFSTKSFLALGAAMAGGALVSLFPGGAAAASVGLAAIGLGIGAFITGLAGISKLGAVLGVDGSAFKVLVTNIAGGLASLNQIEGEGLLKKIGAIAGIGPALFAAMAGTGATQITDGIVDGAKKVMNFLFGTDFKDQKTTRKNMIRDMVDSMKPLQELPDNLGQKLETIGSALSKFMVTFNKVAGGFNIDEFSKSFSSLAITLSETRKLLYVMANGGTYQMTGFGNRIKQAVGSALSFAGFDNELGKITFGKEGSGGLLDPNLKTDQLVSQVGRVNTILGRNNTVQSDPPNLNTSRRERRRGGTAGSNNTVIDNNVRSTNVNNSAPIIAKSYTPDLQDSFMVSGGRLVGGL